MADIIIGGAVAAAVVRAILYCVKSRKNGCGCGCENCTRSCKTRNSTPNPYTPEE